MPSLALIKGGKQEIAFPVPFIFKRLPRFKKATHLTLRDVGSAVTIGNGQWSWAAETLNESGFPYFFL